MVLKDTTISPEKSRFRDGKRLFFHSRIDVVMQTGLADPCSAPH
jgi:hypothetical protein